MFYIASFSRLFSYSGHFHIEEHHTKIKTTKLLHRNRFNVTILSCTKIKNTKYFNGSFAQKFAPKLPAVPYTVQYHLWIRLQKYSLMHLDINTTYLGSCMHTHAQTTQLLPLLLKSLSSSEVGLKVSTLQGLLSLIQDTPLSVAEHTPTLVPRLLALAQDKASMVMHGLTLACLSYSVSS